MHVTRIARSTAELSNLKSLGFLSGLVQGFVVEHYWFEGLGFRVLATLCVPHKTIWSRHGNPRSHARTSEP